MNEDVTRVRLRRHASLGSYNGRPVLFSDGGTVLNDQQRAVLGVLAAPEGISVGELRRCFGVAAASVLREFETHLQYAERFDDAGLHLHALDAYLSGALERPVRRPREACVGIVGCGGIGSELARHLVAVGCGHLVLIDYDSVHASNLNRQYAFHPEDIGALKAERLAERLGGMGTTFETRHACITAVSHLKALQLPALDALINCADRPSHINQVVADYALGTGALFSRAGVGVRRGSWGPTLLPGDVSAYDDPYPTDIERLDDVPTASFGPTNSWIAACLAQDVIHVMMGCKAPSRLAFCVVHFDTLETTRIVYDAA